MEAVETKIKMNGSLKSLHAARATGGVVVVFILFIFSLWIWPLRPVEFNRVILDHDRVQAGHALSYTLYLNKYTDHVPQITRVLIPTARPEETISLTTMTMGSSTIGDKRKRIQVGIPSWIEPGVSGVT